MPSNGGSAITNYKIYRCSGSQCTEQLFTTLGNVTSYKDTSTVRGTTYYYQVTAVSSAGESPRSNEA